MNKGGWEKGYGQGREGKGGGWIRINNEITRMTNKTLLLGIML